MTLARLVADSVTATPTDAPEPSVPVTDAPESSAPATKTPIETPSRIPASPVPSSDTPVIPSEPTTTTAGPETTTPEEPEIQASESSGVLVPEVSASKEVTPVVPEAAGPSHGQLETQENEAGTATVPDAKTDELAATGAQNFGIVAAGLGLLILGIVVLRMVRHRKLS